MGTFYGAAWNFEGRIFFSANSGAGVYEVLLDTIDLTAGTAQLNLVGKSDPTKNNDGMNCPAAPIPYPTCGDKNPGGPMAGQPVTDAECGKGYQYNPAAAKTVCEVNPCAV